MSSFSVLMSLYDGEKESYLVEALESIKSQTILPSEVVLVYDGPIRIQLKEIVDGYSKYIPIRVIKLEFNLGLSNALNIGLKECKNDLVFRFDTDDICIPERFEKQYKFMVENPNVDVCSSYAYEFCENKNQHKLLQVPLISSDITKGLWACPFIHPAVVFRRDFILSIGSYNPNSGTRQDDYELWIRCGLNNATFANIPEPLLYYRVPSNRHEKNTFEVGKLRFKHGLTAVRHFSPNVIALMGIIFPMVRALLPVSLASQLSKLVSKFDPRKK